MYNTIDFQDGYCLLSYAFRQGIHLDPTHKRIHQTTSYCLRTSEEDNITIYFTFQNPAVPSFTFVQLKAKNIIGQKFFEQRFKLIIRKGDIILQSYITMVWPVMSFYI
jgi:hypothetical protein